MTEHRRWWALAAILWALLSSTAAAFYIPGLAPVAYDASKNVVVEVNGLHSIRAVVPYDYYFAPYCPLVEHPSALKLKLGEILMGDSMRLSNYVVQMQSDEACVAMACASDAHRTLTSEAAQRFEKLINDGYRAHLYIDNLPAFSNRTRIYQGRCRDATLEKKVYFDFQRGYPLGVPRGCTVNGKTLINNHLHFRIQYNRVDPKDGYYFLSDTESGVVRPGEKRRRMPPAKKEPSDTDDDKFIVVGFTVEAFSIKWDIDDRGGGGIRGATPCDDKFNAATTSLPPLTTADVGSRIAWTFGVVWEEADVRWASRWDSYLHTSFADSNDSVHWFSIINTLLMVVCLASSIAVVLLRALRKDLMRYNVPIEALAGSEESKELARDESGWKAVHGDVFRTPPHADALIVFTASGLQLYAVSVLVLVTACLGFQSPSRRGSLVTTAVFLSASMSVVAGYGATRMRLTLLGEHAWRPIVAVGSLLPVLLLGCFLAANVVLRAVGSSGAVPTASLVVLLSLWVTVTLPLTIVGASAARHSPPTPHPTRINAIPRPLKPTTALYANPSIVLISGVVPLTTLLLEVRFIFQSLWQGMVYYVFGFLGVVFALWTVTAALTAVVAVYYRLSGEDHRWWWLAFVAPTSCGLQLAVFVVYYYVTTLNFASMAAVALYFIYMTLATALYVLMGGFVGLFATWAFVNKIYSTLKLE